MRVDYVRVYWRLGARKKGIGEAFLTAGTVRMPNGGRLILKRFCA
jgi:hypothetical protein